MDKRLSAYVDGVLPDARRARLEREMERDPALREALQRTQSLGRLVRDSWSEGPPAPPTDFVIASLRSQLHGIDRERRARPAWQQALERARVALGHWFGPVPIATSAAAAFLLAITLLPNMPNAFDPVNGTGATLPVTMSRPEPMSPLRARSQSSARPTPLFAPADFSTDSSSIYDVSPSERPAMIFQGKDGSTVLWLLDDDGLSRFLGSLDLWG
jgi:anti-sigma factor RsiW